MRTDEKSQMGETIEERAKKIRLLIMDVDGVLTDGRIVYDEWGDELKFFDVQDGAGLWLWASAGLRSAIITARKTRLVKRRAKEMRVTKVYQNAFDKRKVYDKCKKRFRVSDEEICYIGDDLMDIPILKKAGLAVSVPNGSGEAKSVAHYITQASGGRGAIREVIEIILKSQGEWEKITSRYLA